MEAGCACAAAAGISPHVRLGSASWTGVTRERRSPAQEKALAANSASEEEGDMAASACLFGSSIDGVGLVPGVFVAGCCSGKTVDSDVPVARACLVRRRH